MSALRVCLWAVTGEWSGWQDLTGESMSREEYRERLAAAASEAMRAGQEVCFVRMSPEEMLAAIKSLGRNNTKENRAAVIAGAAPARMGLKISSDAVFVGGNKIRDVVASAYINGTREMTHTEPVREDGLRAAVIRILARYGDGNVGQKR